MPEPTILAFDTSAAHCAAALLSGGRIVADAHEEMSRGQGERLMAMLSEVLARGGMDFADLTALGVGIGPGNFTGIRISVATARGLALGLGVPAIGVSVLDALALDAPQPILACLTAPRDQWYLQRFGHGIARGPALVEETALADWALPELTVVGQDSARLADRLGLCKAPAAYAPASAIARIATRRVDRDAARPAPLYIRAPDAAPARAVPPVA